MSLYFLFSAFLLNSISGCKKENSANTENQATSSYSADANASSYSADLIDKWITMQLRLMRNATGIANIAFSRYYAYSGIAALESLTPGLPKKML
jgi:hypothetical protein